MPHGMAKIETKKIFNVKKKLKVTLKTGKGALSFLNKLQNYQILQSMCVHVTLIKMNPEISWVPKRLQMVTAVMKLKDACSLEEKP